MSDDYAADSGDSADRLVRLGCLDYTENEPERLSEAEGLRVAHPELTSESLAAAIVCGDSRAVRSFLRQDSQAATTSAPPYGWTPLMYLAYSRLDSSGEQVVDIARTLIAAGADPNDGRFFSGPDTIPFTVLTGVLGGGERGEPPHRHAEALARTLLESGADPNDAQGLYNLQFDSPDTDAHDRLLALLFEFGLGHGDGGPWRRLLPDVVGSPRVLVRRLLRWAVVHDQIHRVELLAESGVDVLAPLGAQTPLELALRNGHRDLADRLRGLGAAEPQLDPADRLVAAALAGDRATAGTVAPEVVAEARQVQPAAIVWAAALRRPGAVQLLLDLGWDVDVLGRGDLPSGQPWQTALHTAVEHDDAATVGVLLAGGADRTIRDARFDGTALDWAEHLERTQLLDVLAR